MTLLASFDHAAMRRYARHHASGITLDQHAASLSFIEHCTDWPGRSERYLFPELAAILDGLHNIAVMFGREATDKLAELMPQLVEEYFAEQEMV